MYNHVLFYSASVLSFGHLYSPELLCSAATIPMVNKYNTILFPWYCSAAALPLVYLQSLALFCLAAALPLVYLHSPYCSARQLPYLGIPAHPCTNLLSSYLIPSKPAHTCTVLLGIWPTIGIPVQPCTVLLGSYTTPGIPVQPRTVLLCNCPTPGIPTPHSIVPYPLYTCTALYRSTQQLIYH